MDVSNTQIAVALGAVIVAYGLYRRASRISVSDLAGPSPSSFLLGNLKELYQGLVGDADLEWTKLYGGIVRFKGAVGEDMLLVSDPKALQYIISSAGYNFPKMNDGRVISRMISGRGILWAEGDSHKRQRKVMSPGFGAKESKAFLPTFLDSAELMSSKWMEELGSASTSSVELNVQEWVSRATLDAMGEAAFDYKFNTLHGDENPLAKAYSNFLKEAFGFPSDSHLLSQALSRYLPFEALEWLSDHMSSDKLVRMRQTKEVSVGVAKGLVKDKAEMITKGAGSKDVFSLLLKANMDTEARAKLTEEELYSAMHALMTAGHETTAATISWLLWRMAKHPEVQKKVRAEIRQVEATTRARGDSQFSMADLESMTYTLDVMKESLRIDNVDFHVHRCAGQDEVIPLSKPLTTRSGKVITEVPVPKGTGIIASAIAYHRNPEIWGEDANEFNPDRWETIGERAQRGPTVGVYANLMTFLGGVRSCIGWRFALIEIQAFFVHTVNNFELSLTDKADRIRRSPCLIMVPTVEGEEEKGAYLPLQVKVAPREDN
ncbi:cytochrome P450 [Coniophora puteana RWD-64-598 SS2]|uniref:Cytochrome P450 n=1 Tax=Coniophora puteana (strain RWD-64-598) TaxID=741705 RepID=A0A5M3MMT2_CONPW|nr:cytochrome P450 [Coniophora puteana RWD-64-598 SS2]EIW80413.1 cytochrome P450 [Coniophora puteana RWD-64-598 SS2]